MDDIMVASMNVKEHLKALKGVFIRLVNNNNLCNQA